MGLLERQHVNWVGGVALAATACVLFVCGSLLHSVWREIAGRDLIPLTFMATIGPDGDRVYYDALMDGVPCIIVDSIQNWGIRPALVITNGSNPLLSRDGRLLFFDRTINARREVWSYDTSNQRERCVVSLKEDCSVYDVNSDGSQIIATTSVWGGGLGSLVRHLLVDVESGDVTPLPDYGATFLKDKGIVHSQPGQQALWLQSSNESIQRIVPQGHFPSASPNGERLLYVADLSNSVKQWKWEVYDLAEDRVIPVGRAMSPSLSSDGKKVVFVGDSVVNGFVWSLDLETHQRTNLGRVPGYISGWRTSSGGVAALASGTVIVFDARTNTLRQLPTAPLANIVTQEDADDAIP